MALEYRVVWEREGRRRQTRILQSWNAACRKLQAVWAGDKAKVGTDMDTMPDLIGRPILQVRECTEWVEVEQQPYDGPLQHVIDELHVRWGGDYPKGALPLSNTNTEIPF